VASYFSRGQAFLSLDHSFDGVEDLRGLTFDELRWIMKEIAQPRGTDDGKEWIFMSSQSMAFD
jgi:hypothetical protein